MANSGRINLTVTGTYGNITGWITWEESDVNTTANTSKVTAKLHYKNAWSGSTYSSVANPPFTLTINGNTKSTSTGATLPAYSADTVVLTHTVTVTHNNDGSKSVTISGGGGLSGTSDLQNSSGSGTATLTTILRNKPTATMTVSPVNPTAISSWNVYIKGYTRVSFAITGTPHPDSGATISAYEFSGNGQIIDAQTGTTNVLASSGSVKLHGWAQDSRGVWSDDAEQTISVYDYAIPKFTSATAYRSDSSGTKAASGTYIKISCAAAVGASIDNHNDIASIVYTVYDNDTGTQAATGTLTNEVASIVSGFALDSSYRVEIVVTDTIGSTVSRTIVVPIAVVTFHLKEGGLGAAFGGDAETEKAVDFHKWTALGRVFGLGFANAITYGDFDDFKEPGIYGVASNSIAGNIANIPSANAGTLRVWIATGEDKEITSTWHYVGQMYIDIVPNVYIRIGSSGSTAGVYTWGAWKQVTLT